MLETLALGDGALVQDWSWLSDDCEKKDAIYPEVEV